MTGRTENEKFNRSRKVSVEFTVEKVFLKRLGTSGH